MDDRPFTVELVDKTATGLAGKAVVFPDGPCEVETHLVEVAPGRAVGRHQHPGPCWMYVLEGSLTIESDDGIRHTFEAGEAFVEDARMWVDNQNPGATPARFLAVVVSGPDTPKISFED